MTTRGIDCELHLQTTGARAAWPASGIPANLDEIDIVQDVRLSDERDEVELKLRKHGGFAVSEFTTRKISLEIDILYDPDDPNFIILLAAYQGNNPVAIAVCDQDPAVEGAQGIWADWKIGSFSQPQEAAGVVMCSLTLKFAHTDVSPEDFVTVAES